MRNLIGKDYQPVGFVLLGVLIGAGLTLVIQGRVATSDIVLGVVYLLAFAMILVNNRNNALFYSMLCLWGAVLAIETWTHHRSLFGVILWGIFSLIYACSAWQAHIEQKKTRADLDPRGTSLAALGRKGID